MVFVADDFGAWLVGLLAEVGRKKLITWVFGTEQERALQHAATAAIQLTAGDLCPESDERAEELAMVVSQVFAEPKPESMLTGQATFLETLEAGVTGQLALLDDPNLTGTWQSSAEVLQVRTTVLAEKLTGYLVREIVVRGARGGPLAPLSAQLNHNMTHLQGQRVEDIVGRLDSEVRKALAQLETPHATAVSPVALDQLPPEVAEFTGRDAELAVLAELLDPMGMAGPVLVSAVTGLAGIGKTTLAVEAGHAARRRGWFGGVLFIDLHGYDEVAVEPGQALDALLRALGVRAEDVPPHAEARAGLYRSVLAKISDPVLLIVDNASSEAQVRPLLPGTGQHKVVVTSRDTLPGLGARLVDVAVLDVEAAVGLLDRALRVARPDDHRITGDIESATVLARVCGRLPLALQIAAALLKADPALTATGLADELANESARLGQLVYDDGGGSSAPSVAAAFELSYRRLKEIPARVFRLLPVNPGPDVSTAAVANLADLPVTQTRRVLAALTRAHLCEAAPGTVGRWRMHDLMRLYAQHLSDTHADADGREEARDRLLSHYLTMAGAADSHLGALPGMHGGFISRDDALAWLDAERTSLIAAVSMAAGTGRDQIALWLPLMLGEYLALRRHFDEWLGVLAVSLDAARRLGDQSGEGNALNNLGSALQWVRRFEEAITAHQKAAAIFRETGDRHGEGNVLTNLGAAALGLRRFEEAITALQRAAAIFRETGDWYSEGKALNNLGAALQGVGRLEEAITAHRDAAVIYRESGDRRSEGGALNNLGLALVEVGRPDEAITVCQDAAAIFRETGDQHANGRALNNVGLALVGVGRPEEAIVAHQKAAVIFQETGDQHSEGDALNNLGGALQQVERFEEAIIAHQKAAASYRETGDRHGEAKALANLGLAERRIGRLEEAITVCQDAVAIFRETGDRAGESSALIGLGAALLEAEQWEEAITVCQDVVAIFRETGDRHDEGITLNNLGLARRKTGRLEEAINAHQAAVAIFRETGDRADEGIALNQLGAALQAVERLEEAIIALQKAAVIFHETGDRYGERSTLANLSAALLDTGRLQEMITVLQDTVVIFREIGDRQGEGEVRTGLGLALIEAGEFEEAITAFQDAVVIFRETGDRHAEEAALENLKAAQSARAAQ
jgi:tetratricopeptide (TPR) repeat protein